MDYRKKYPQKAQGLAVGGHVTLTLRGTIKRLRQDSDGLKVNISGDSGGFFVYVHKESPDVGIAVTQAGDGQE